MANSQPVTKTGLKTVGYMGVIPLLVEAVKTQQRQIEALRKEIDELERRLPASGPGEVETRRR